MRIRPTINLAAAISIASVILVATSIITLQLVDAYHAEVTLNLNSAVRKISLIRGFLPELSGTSGERAEKQWQAQYADLTPILNKIPYLDRQTQSLKARVLENHTAIGMLFARLSGTGQSEKYQSDRLIIQEQLDVRTASMVSDILALNDVATAYINTEKRWMDLLLAVSVTFLAGVIVGLLLIFYRRIVTPIIRLDEAAKQLSSGKFDIAISISGSDEITSLATSFDRMRIALRNRLTELDMSNATIKIEVNERKVANDLLEKSLNKIQSALVEKDLLLGEIHHRVKNNLQVVQSLLNLQSSQITDPVVKSMLMDSQNRIQSMALIHRTLYQSHDFASVDFSSFLNALIPPLLSTYGADQKRIKLNIDAGSVFIPINSAIPCGLIVNELITNALKHAFPGNQQGEISIVLQRLQNNQIVLEIIDNGIGIPGDLDLERVDTLGLQLVNLLSRQLQGVLSINRFNPTRFSLEWICKERDQSSALW